MLLNIDIKTGIRYGVIPHYEVGQAWYDDSTPHYHYSCQYCGGALNQLNKGNDQVKCGYCYKPICEADFDFIEPISFFIKESDLQAEQDSDSSDIFVLKSPFYTFCELCSPCAPGAGYLTNDGIYKAYCFGHDWFEGETAPYRVYSVKTDKEILSGRS